MAGAFSFVLGIFGLGAAGAVSAGQNAKIKKADYQYGEEHGLHGTSEVLQMRERVRKEWWSICGKTYNACERPAYVLLYNNIRRTAQPSCQTMRRFVSIHPKKLWSNASFCAIIGAGTLALHIYSRLYHRFTCWRR